MSALGDALRKERRIEVKVGDITFLGTRATMEQALGYKANGTSDAAVARAHIDGWEGVKECDLIEGGRDQKTPFDKDVFDQLVAEKIDWWKNIAEKVLDDAFARFEERQNNEKKSKTGSKTSS